MIDRINEYPENKGKNIVVNLDSDVTQMIFDKSVIERVVENMINFATSNVSEDGKVVIETQTLNDGMLQFTIHDNGTQIPEKYREKIFEKFSQAEIKNEGYRVERALGLTFCKLAIEAHNGKMWLDENIKVGNRFVLELASLTDA
jgi:K+-sensing histidine kinase KdpD